MEKAKLDAVRSLSQAVVHLCHAVDRLRDGQKMVQGTAVSEMADIAQAADSLARRAAAVNWDVGGRRRTP